MLELLTVLIIASSNPTFVGETLEITRYNSDCKVLELASTGFEVGRREFGERNLFIEYAGSFKEYVCTDNEVAHEMREIIEIK